MPSRSLSCECNLACPRRSVEQHANLAYAPAHASCADLQGLALLHDAANNSSTARREDDAQAASQPLFRAANALRDASEDASMHEGGFGSPIDSSSGACHRSPNAFISMCLPWTGKSASTKRAGQDLVDQLVHRHSTLHQKFCGNVLLSCLYTHHFTKTKHRIWSLTILCHTV